MITAFAYRVSSLNEPCAAADGAETPIDEALQMFADWVKAYYANRPVLEV